MFRRKRDSLPTAMYSPINGRSVADGSGRAIRMEAPIVRAWKASSGYTKGTYYSLLFNFFLVFWGFRAMMNSNASIWLTCHAVDCTLQITPPSREGTTEFKFSRKQLVRTDSIVVDKDHQFVRFDTGPPAAHHYSAKARKKKKQSRSGPDIDGNFATYTIVLRPPIENTDPNDETGQYEADLTPLEDFTYRDADTDNVVLHMRKYNLGKTHRRSKTMSNKIDSYVKQRRHQLVIKENAPISWQGILALVIGLFLLLLTVLIGQFAEEPRTGGPGTRRSAGSSSSSTARRSSGGTSRKHTSGKLH